jgi:hypothetical protein
MAEGRAAAALLALDDDTTIEVWMIGREESRPEIPNLCAS